MWLQQLLYRHPESLPVADIESTFTPLIPVCVELSTPSGGYIDILFVTPQGRLAVVEVKLWRNPQARREVIGQILEYAKDLSGWNYEGLDTAIRAARRNEGYAEDALALLDVAKSAVPGLEERAFIDGVSLSMLRGDLLLLIVGDGIRQGVSAIAEFLEGHGSLHFTLGPVEMPVFKDRANRFLLQPRVLAQSLIVRRSVVTIDASGISTVADEAEAAGVEVVADIDPALLETRQYFSDFWGTFLKGCNSTINGSRCPSHPALQISISLSRPTQRHGSVRTSPGRNRAWACTSRSNVALSRHNCIPALLAHRDEIEKALGVEVDWEHEGDDKYYVISRKDFPDVTDPRFRTEIIDWLRDRSNRFVTVFRPADRSVAAGSPPGSRARMLVEDPGALSRGWRQIEGPACEWSTPRVYHLSNPL